MNPQCPQSYAKHLAGYISDPSTIRVRVLEYFDRAPSLEQCRKFRETVKRGATLEGRRVVGANERFSCGHPRTEENTIWIDGHTERCKTCRRAIEAEAARRYRVKQAKRRAAQEARRLKLEARQQAFIERNLAALAAADSDSLVDRICAGFAITREDFSSRDTHIRFVLARSVFVKLLRDRGLSLLKIGALMGRDHSSVSNLLKKFDDRLAKHPEMAAVYGKLAA